MSNFPMEMASSSLQTFQTKLSQFRDTNAKLAEQIHQLRTGRDQIRAKEKVLNYMITYGIIIYFQFNQIDIKKNYVIIILYLL